MLRCRLSRTDAEKRMLWKRSSVNKGDVFIFRVLVSPSSRTDGLKLNCEFEVKSCVVLIRCSSLREIYLRVSVVLRLSVFF